MNRDILLRIRASNNRLVSAREAMGYHSAMAFCRAMKINYSLYVQIESFRQSPLTKHDQWTRTALLTARAIGVEPAELWPASMRRLLARELRFEVDTDQLPGISEFAQLAAVGPERVDQWPWTPEELAEHISHLRPRDQVCLRLLFEDQLTLEETGSKLGISHARVQQIRDRAVDKLREMADCEKYYANNRYARFVEGVDRSEDVA